jgi:hypothetical protein
MAREIRAKVFYAGMNSFRLLLKGVKKYQKID